MSDMIADGLAWLASVQKASCSQTITYIRGAQQITIQATFALQMLRVTDHEGNTKVERPDADFIFTAADLDFGAGPVEPADGDIIQATFGAVTKQFEARPVNHGSEPSWHYEDPFEVSVIVHGKYIGDV